ncbi:nucleotidyltransferase domain-containing protein [bacterium]|nr:nucleotidyltransferase domain-containing protein [bacterium]
MTRQESILIKIKNIILEKEPDARIILYGSRARGDSQTESDWDILILLNKDEVDKKMEQSFRHFLFDLELEIGEPISVFVYSKMEWENKYSVTPYYKQIKSEGVSIT